MESWDDLRIFLEVCRAGRIPAAARHLGVSASTVSRRLAALERETGARLLERTEGELLPTVAGARLKTRLEKVEQELGLASGEVSAASAVRVVRITAPEALGGEILVPLLGRFRALHPEIALELVAENRVLSVVRREADIALRLQIPEERSAVGVRVGTVVSNLYASASYASRHGLPRRAAELAQHALVGDGVEMGQSRESRWLVEHAASASYAFRSDSTYARFAAIRAGWGIGIIPAYLARSAEELRVLKLESGVPARELWLVIHPELRRDRTVRAVVGFLTEELHALSPRLAGR